MDLPTQLSLARGCVDLVGRYFDSVDHRASRSGRSRQPTLGSGFRLFLAHELDKLENLHSPADDPNAVLQRLIDNEHGDADPLPSGIVRLLEGARHLLRPLVDRSRPTRPTDLVFASVCVVAAISHLKEQRPARAEPVRELTGVLATLITLTFTAPTGIGVVLARA